MPGTVADAPWWDAVKQLVILFDSGFSLSDEGSLRTVLHEMSFDGEEIDRALAWLESVYLMGNLTEVLSMLRPQTSGLRIQHPKEGILHSGDLWSIVSRCRHKGLLSQDVAERVLDGVASLDTSDWTREEAREFVVEVAAAHLPGHSRKQLASAIRGRKNTFYS